MSTNAIAQVPMMKIHSLEQIKHTAQTFIQNQIQAHPEIKTIVNVGHIDPRLRLQQCEQRLKPSETNPNTRASNRVIKVTCSGQKPWSIFIPVKISQYANVLVAKKTIYRGTALSKEDLIFSEQQLERLTRGYFLASDNIRHMLAKRTIAANTILTPGHLKLPFLVKKGQNVAIHAQVSGIEIKMLGKAMMNGARGDLIKVRNTSSEKVLHVIVKARGKVEVQM